jgi:hypothetical protein
MQNTIAKIKKEDEEWEDQCEQEDYSPDKELGKHKGSRTRTSSIQSDILVEESETHSGTTCTSSAKTELPVTPTKSRKLPAPGRQYRKAFIPTPPLMSPVSPPDPSSDTISNNKTSNNSNGNVNGSSLMKNHSFQSVSPQEDTSSPTKQSTAIKAPNIPQSKSHDQLPLPPPALPLEKGKSSRPKYGPVMRRTWSMDNVSAADQYQSTLSIDSGVVMMGTTTSSGSDLYSKVNSQRRSSTSSISSDHEVFTDIDSEYKSRSESPVTNHPATECVSPTILVTQHPEIQGQKFGRSGEIRHSHSATETDKSTNKYSTGQKLATIPDESPSEKQMLKEWSEAEGNVRFVLDRRAQRRMARQVMISSEPVSPSSPRLPLRLFQMPLSHSSPKSTVPFHYRQKSLTLQHQPFLSPQVHRKCLTIGSGSAASYELYRAASENILSSLDDSGRYEGPAHPSTLRCNYINDLSLQKGHLQEAKLGMTVGSPMPTSDSPLSRRGRGSFPQVRYSAVSPESPITDL